MMIFRDECKFSFSLSLKEYIRTVRSQRASRVSQNLEEASKERGTLYVLSKLQLSVLEWIQCFSGYVKWHLLKQDICAKTPRINKARKEKDKGMQLFFTTNQFRMVWFLKEKENYLNIFQSFIEKNYTWKKVFWWCQKSEQNHH